MTEKRKKECMDYECSICKKRHEIDTICPQMLEKINKYSLQKKKNFMYGNIFLECLKKNINIFDLMYEASYLTEMYTMRFANGGDFNMEMAIDYFAMELDCSPIKFIRSPEQTIEEIMKLGRINYDSVQRDNGKISWISFSFSFYEDIPDFKYSKWDSRIELYAVKEKDIRNNWVYRIYMNSPMVFINGMDQKKHGYSFLQLGYYGSILIVEDYNGRLAEAIEDTIDTCWDQIATKVSADDVRFNIWIRKIEEETKVNRLLWRKKGNYYVTQCESYSIKLGLNCQSKENVSAIVHQFSVRINQDETFTFIIPDDDLRREELFFLEEKIITAMKWMVNLENQSDLEEKQIEFTDVLVISSSMYCRVREHEIIPYRGIVNILTKDNVEEKYYIYVGYCQKCGTYTAFNLDYRKMLEKGEPLCAVYQYDEYSKGKFSSKFAYKSQSILNAKGYNVQADSDLTEQERQNILKNCLDKNLVQIHDVLDFLNWLIRTREPLQKYKNAVGKWKTDIAFVEAYKEEERSSVVVNSILVK